MAVFEDLDWRRLDTFALLAARGVCSIESSLATAAAAWLVQNAFAMERLDFSSGIGPVVERLGRLLNWEQEFGYRLEPTSRNLAALHDGFDFEVPPSGGLVLEVVCLERALEEDASWTRGFLSIVSEHSLRALAQGRRLFALIQVRDHESPLVGLPFEELQVTYPFPFRDVAA